MIGVSEADAHIYFAITSITAPIFGAIFSGVIGSRIGGHESPYAVPSCLISAVFIAVCAVLVPFMKDINGVIFLIWGMLFGGGYILPLLTGIMLV